MADVAASTAIFADYPESYMGGTSHMSCFTTKEIGYVLFFTGVGQNLVYKKTTDGGGSFGAEVSIATNAAFAPNCPCIWFDKWTTGGTGTVIHIGYVDVDDIAVRYRSLTTSSDTLGTDTKAIELSAFDFETTLSCAQICKARGGNLYIMYNGDDGGTPVNGFARSVDAGANWTSRTSPIEVLADGPFFELLPGNAADNQDMYAVYGDQSASAITVKTYDDSGNSWGESAAQGSTVVLGTAGLRQISAFVQHSDGLIVVGINTHIDNAAGDFIVATFDGTNWSTKTNVLTDKDDWAIPQMFCDQNTDDWYACWLGNPDGSSTWTATVSVYYAISTDQGANWGAPVNYDEGTDDDYRCLWAGHSTPGPADGLFGLFWQDDDDNDLWFNAVRSIELSAASGATGTIGATLTKATASLTGAQTQSGTLASVLQAALFNATGAMQPSGVIASTLQPALMNATGAQIYTGVIASLMQAALMNAAGTQSQSGTIASTLQAALFNATGHMAPSGVIAAQLQAALFNATGELPSEGTIATTLQSALLNATGVMMPSGAIAATLQAALFNAEGNLPVDGSLAATLTAALFNATGAMQPSGAIASALQPALFNASGSHTVNMTGTMAATLTMALFSGTGALTQTGAMIATLQTLLFSGQGAQAAAAIALIVYLMGLDETAFKGQGLDELRRLASGLDLTGLVAAGYDESTLKRAGLDETVFAGRGLD